MSIKTSKRIALGVIAGLVFAPFAAIAPANAASVNGDDFVLGTATITSTNTTHYARIGQEISIPVSGTVAALTAAATKIPALSIAAAITSQPTDSSVYPSLTSRTTAIGTNLDIVNTGLVYDDSGAIATAVTSTGSASAIATLNYSADTANEAITEEATAITLATLKVTPTKAGVYTVTVWNEKDRVAPQDVTATVAANAAAQASLSGSESFKTFTITVTGAPSTVALSAYNSTAAVGGTDGSLIKVSLTDENGAAAVLIAGQTVTITPTGTGDIAKVNGANVTSAAGAAYLLSSNDFDSATGAAWINVISTDDSTGIQVSATLGVQTSVVTLVFRDLTVSATQELPHSASAALGYLAVDATTVSVPIGAVSTVFRTTATYDADTPKYLGVKVTDTNKKITGYSGTALAYDAATTLASTGAASFTVATSSTVAQALYTIDALIANGTAAGSATTVSSVATTAGTASSDPSSVLAAPGATITLTVNLKDQFIRNYANQALTASVAGRNTVTAFAKATDAAGNAVFTYTDTSTSTTSMTDTVTIVGGVANITVTVTFNAAYVPATIVLTSTGDTDVVPGTTTTDIDAGVDGATGTSATASAKVTNSAGTALVGTPVTFTVTGLTGAEVHTTKVTVYTNNLGVAVSNISSYAAGKATVTATAGTATASDDVYFAQNTPEEARNVKATLLPSGRSIEGIATDRYGNPVENVTLKATVTSGDAFFGTGTTVASGTTAKDGKVTFLLAKDFTAASTVVVSFNTSTYGQSTSAAGYVGAALAANAIEAYVAGTTTTNQEGLGGSFTAAGNNAAAGINVAAPAVVVPPVVYDNPTLSFVKSAGRIILSGTAADGEGDIIIYVKKVGTTAWKERAKTLEVAAPGDFNGSIKAPKSNVLIRVKQEGTGQFSNQIIVVK